MSRKLLPLLILAAAVAVFALLKITRPEPEQVSASERSWLVQVQTVTPGVGTPVLSLYGELVAPDEQTITATLPGRIARLPVREGQQVSRGELLVALDESDLEPVLAEARAQVADLEAQAAAEQVRYRSDRQSLTSEQAILDNARRQFERVESLVARNLASRENLEAVTDALARAELTVQNRERAIAEHPTRLQSLQARLSRARAQLSATELDSERARAGAPFDGVVTGLQVATGDQVAPGQPLLSVYPVQGLEVRARVPQAFVAELSEALARNQSLIATADAGDHQFRLERFAGRSDAAGTEAVLTLQGEPGGLRPGALQSLVLQRPARDNTVMAPYSALYGADRMYLLTDEGRMQAITVERVGETRDRQGNRQLLVRSDQLTRGARLIITHLPNAITGLKVDVATAAGAPAS